MNPGLHLYLLFLSLATWLPASCALASGSEVVIGVLAHRGDQAAISKWTPTIDYLNEEIPGSEFRLLPLDLNEMSAALAEGKLDFILTNPGNYVDLERKFGVSRITTLKNLHFGRPYTVFGAVIFTRADREDIRALRDLDDKSFAAVSADAFGGFQMAWRELRQAGIDPYRDLSRLQFFDFPQDDIVFAVRDRLIDAGTVRAETLERMISEGLVGRADFRILNALSSGDYPFPHSTRLYPEWAFAKVKTTPGALAKSVAIALMKMPAGHPAMIAGDYAGWTVPLNYQPVHELFMELGIGPYQRSGMSAFRELLTRYWYWLVLLVVAVLFSIIHNILVKRQVKLRTLELSQTNLALETEVAERKKAEEDARTLLEEKRYLAQKCMAVQEEERRYLARELHDELGQCITAIQADAEIIQELSGACDSRLKASAGAIQGVSSRIYEVVHSLMLRYRPGVLDDLGLAETIRDEVGAWQARQPDTVYTLNFSGDLDALGEELNICIYRIIQECLTNIAKYARATSVHIDIGIAQAGSTRQLRVEVQDSGAGFDSRATGGGFGLVGMRERVEALHGEFILATTPGTGTRIRVILPLNGGGGYTAS
jgi:two-component system, LuxR family, sensor histidine kinase TtrS